MSVVATDLLSAPLPVKRRAEAAPHPRRGWRNQLAFTLFLLTNVALFLRPTEVLGLPEGIPLYSALLLPCLGLAVPDLLRRIRPLSLAKMPIAVCVLGLPVAAGLSNLTSGEPAVAVASLAAMGSLALYFMLVVALVDTRDRLVQFVTFVAWLSLVLVVLAILGYHQVLTSPALSAMQQRFRDDFGVPFFVKRLVGPGIFHDPNDMCLIIVPGAALWLFKLFTGRPSIQKVIGIGIVLLILAYGLLLTQSRGGFISLMVGIAAFLLVRLGWRRMLPATVLVVPVLAVLFSGRQTSVDLSDKKDTAQERIQLWSKAFTLFEEAPVFGVGHGQYYKRIGIQSHNSFIQSYAEWGFVGGTLFVGAVYLAIRGLYRQAPPRTDSRAILVAQLRPCLLAALCSYITGMLSLTRSFTPPTYLVLALVTAYLVVAGGTFKARVTPALVGKVLLVSLVFLFVAETFVRMTVNLQ